MSRVHELKCWPSAFRELIAGTKTFEYRRNDRDYTVGDVLRIREWDPYVHSQAGSLDRWAQDKAYGREVKALITHIAHGGQFEIPIGFCVMSIVVERSDAGKGGGE